MQADRVLFLDDATGRRSKFIQLVPHGHCVETADACIAKLAEPWDVVFLDHDLGGEAHSDPAGDNTGSAVVRWVAANRPRVRCFVVHSLNTPAGTAMVRGLQDAGYEAAYLPWAWMRADLIIPPRLEQP